MRESAAQGCCDSARVLDASFRRFLRERQQYYRPAPGIVERAHRGYALVEVPAHGQPRTPFRWLPVSAAQGCCDSARVLDAALRRFLRQRQQHYRPAPGLVQRAHCGYALVEVPAHGQPRTSFR
ncbi:hypothetical protein [Amycolatopsis sp. NBRC 101858]|uniref:hypothetical protein n=1 Tax=Amycolatopsis sp. NBRC 101858 TaxID=3032200 RepID=UPI002552C6E5|nr:hypothetical protein [Amycolatopsis sp. NBRC 101858]